MHAAYLMRTIDFTFHALSDFFQILTLRNLVLTRFNQSYLLSFTAHVGSLAALHGIKYGLSQCLHIDSFILCRLRNFAVHNSLFEFNFNCRSNSHARHLFNIDTLFQLLEHSGLKELDLPLCLLLYTLSNFIPRIG